MKLLLVCPSVPSYTVQILNQLLLNLSPEENQKPAVWQRLPQVRIYHPNTGVFHAIQYIYGHSTRPDPSRLPACCVFTVILCDKWCVSVCIYLYNVTLYRKLSKPNRSVVQILTQQTMQVSCNLF